MDLEYLKQATRAEHEGTESTVPLMDPALTRADYISVLQHIYRAVRTWDDWAATHVPPSLSALLEGRQRSPLIEADLAHLASTIPQINPDCEEALAVYLHNDPAKRDAAFLGAMYVIEGSTLGGQYIAKQVEQTFGFEPGCGNAYFRGYGDRTGTMWKSFKAVLGDVPEAQTELVVDSAKRMFAFFAANMTDTAKKVE